MKTIDIDEFTPKPGEEHNASSYPHEGFFLGQVFGNIQLIAVQGFSVSMIQLTPGTILKVHEQNLPKLVEIAPPTPPVVNGITEATFLKALAMAHGTKAEPFTV